MASIKASIWKIFALFGFIATWAEESLKPDEDGIVRVTMEEGAKLIRGMCNVFGWKAEIVMPDGMVLPE